jgi:hypothetical protein
VSLTSAGKAIACGYRPVVLADAGAANFWLSAFAMRRPLDARSARDQEHRCFS